MGLERIKNENNREFWRNFISAAHSELKKAGFSEICFDEFKNDGSYAKAKTGRTATKWVFAEDLSRRWVELELKSRLSNGNRHSQRELYNSIKKTAHMRGLHSLNITWDEEDRNAGYRRIDGKDIRIKIYLKNMDDSQWISTMVLFIKNFQPIILSVA